MPKSHYNANYYAKFRLHHPLKQKLINYIDAKGPVWYYLIKNFSRHSSLLDYGCGSGLFLARASSHFQTTGIDSSSTALKLAAKNTQHQSSLILGKLSALQKLPSASYQIITCFDVIEHIANFNKYLDEFKRLLAPGGVLVISVPNTQSLARSIAGGNWWAYEDSTHLNLYNRNQWLKILDQHQLKLIKIFPSGIINHPLQPYRLTGGLLLLHYFTQTLALLNFPLPTWLSDVDTYILIKL